MPHIEKLSAHVADLIAAGEVVERPASVVKELCENAIDAGAKAVTVEIQHGGMTLVRVTDDGCGIAPEEVSTAFLRHATSKIHSEYDLEAIGTLGFRGEALAAIAAVSRLQILTRRAEDTLGTSFSMEGGQPLGQEEAGCPVGTTLLVRDIFYNTPARLKFMKKDAAEGAACLAVVQRQALAHPEVSFKFIRDGSQELLTPGDGQAKSAMYAVLGRDMALGFTPVEGGTEEVRVTGFASLPTCCRGTRGYQFFFVNGRWVKSAALTAALEQAYANQKMVGKFPGCVLYLEMKLNGVDVNVHPTKQEVKFGAERQVFSAVHYAVLSALGADNTRPAATVSAPAQPVIEGRQTSLPLHDFTNRTPAQRPVPPPVFQKPAVSAPPQRVERPVEKNFSIGKALENLAVPAPVEKVSPPAPAVAERVMAVSTPAPVESARKEPPVAEPVKTAPVEMPDIPEKFAEPAPAAVEKISPRVPEPPRTEELPPEPVVEEESELPWRVAGELFHTYILVEQGDKALLIDKHAAHERMNFDRMRAEDYLPMSQTLLTPVVFTPAPEESAVLLEHLDELDRLGFDISDFGGGSLAVRAVPDYVSLGDVEATLTEIADKLSLSGSTGWQERRDELLHTMACKAAIKGGWKSGPEELERVARAVMAGEVKYCPHGRPVAIELTRSALEKQFKRA